ncbi:KTSC domain-containing protein [Tardiphaga sp. OK245]|uniref:KTSC domain-containing protein n=1 Tax=Tardiphaga sp. OK245 TaxID=1855306 RepID=UPI0008A7A5F3|nr:KTSC domain-containing protein [Tardiphaga sp. OK245]SEH40107.1 KTSC domain-containing protein [Tardiphaga sp. OK245]
MNWIETPDSSNIARFAYTKETQVLTVEFKKGERYEYFDVPETVFEAMKAASSKGQYHAQNVKNKFRYARA